MRRRLLGALGLLVFICAAIGVYVALVPLHLDWLNARVTSRLEKVTGVPVRMQDASLHVLQGLYRIRNLTFHGSGDANTPGLAIAQVNVDISPLAALFGRRRFIESIQVHAPSELELLYDRHGVQLGPRAAFLGKVLRNAEPGKEPAEFAFGEVRLTGASVRLVNRETTPSAEILPVGPPGAEDTVIRGLEVSAHTRGEHELVTEFQGILSAGQHDSVLAGGLQLAEGQASVWFSSPRLQVGDEPRLAEANRLECKVDLAREKDGYAGHATLGADDLALTSPRQRLAITDQAVALSLGFHYNPENSVLSVHEASARSQQADAHASGTISLAAPHAFEGKVKASRMGVGYERLLGTFLPRGYRVDSQPESFSLDVAGSGDSQGMTNLVGKLGFTTVTIAAPALRRPLESVNGELDFEPGRLVFHQISGRLGEGEVTINGALSGDYLREGKGRLAFDWSATAASGDIAALLPRDLRVKAQPGGSIAGAGHVEQEIDLFGGGVAAAPEITGNLEVKDVVLAHPQLPGGIKNVNGTLDIRTDSISIGKLTGELPDGKLSIKGTVSGNEVFWRDPVLTGSLAATLDIDRVLGYLSEEQRTRLAPYHIRGQAICELGIRTKLAGKAEEPELKGKIHLRDTSFDPHHRLITGTFTTVNGTVEWDGSDLRIATASGLLNGQPISLSGHLSGNEIAVNLDSSPDLAVLQTTFPWVDKWYELSGPASCQFGFRVSNETASAPGLLPLLKDTPGRIADAIARRTYDLTGKVQFGRDEQGASIRHRGMPPARRDDDGRDIPRAELRNVFGTGQVSRDLFVISRSQPARCEFADSRNCRLSGQIQMRQGNFPKMDFDLDVDGEARLDSWLFGWGKAGPKPVEVRPGNETFELVGQLSSKTTYYRGVRSGPLNASIRFTSTRNKPPRVTEIRNIKLQGWGGTLDADFRIQSWPPESDVPSPQWATHVDIRQMRMLPLLACVFRDVRNIDGIITGQLDLKGVGKDTDRVTGTGAAAMSSLAVSRTPLIQRLGETTQHSFEGMTFETASSTSFRVGGGAMSTDDLRLQTNGLLLEMHGSYYFDKRIDAMMRLNFFTTVLGEIPLLGELANLADRAVGKLLLAFRISGTAGNPRVQPVLFALFQGGA